ncbi:hypothetical protein GUITHDRAFT_111930 [Guillardia theta CCMP2712]|uniref:Zn(2)-C6 fungal-type domain-containing protein n=1 Tax=Guillardia theta (strain CCMP2712) TaxID=905079 RepID=L1J0M1_GUITC|nr:hypothetical protein GUITHDRAFT_111930 [Guillardia theta CCMP2712]EKX42078.1 hypothetical protein GUITHDRAFT_111930 [Guillardia theta CCMP2712]|eukprot:XP_005829058.1 hypothetical protein GUITHDRAFT_111930 [Guillardia theta CCMP2712]
MAAPDEEQRKRMVRGMQAMGSWNSFSSEEDDDERRNSGLWAGGIYCENGLQQSLAMHQQSMQGGFGFGGASGSQQTIGTSNTANGLAPNFAGGQNGEGSLNFDYNPADASSGEEDVKILARQFQSTGPFGTHNSEDEDITGFGMRAPNAPGSNSGVMLQGPMSPEGIPYLFPEGESKFNVANPQHMSMDDALPYVMCFPEDVESFVSSEDSSYFNSDEEQPQTEKRVRQACQACKQKKAKCDDDTPCARCIADHQECVREVNLPYRRMRQKRREQTKLACKPCRRRKLKCEENRPCWRCLRDGQECIDDKRNRDKKSGSSDESVEGSSHEAASPHAIPGLQIED